MKKRPIVAFAHHPWVEPEWMNRQQLLSRLGQRGWPIAYTYGALDWWQRRSEYWKQAPLFNEVIDRDGIRDIQPGRLGAKWQRFPAFESYAIARHARFARATVARPDERIIALLFEPQYYPYIEYLQPCDIAFHAYDAFAGQPGWTQEEAAYQRVLVERSFLVTVSSESIARKLDSDKVRILPNGADVEAFLHAPELAEPDDLRPIPHPRLGYVGAINRKVDLVLIEKIATARPAWHWVLVGRIDRQSVLTDDYNADAFMRCEALPNVHFLGQKDRRVVPCYVGHMSLNTMCYRTGGDGWWNAGSPLKLHEYLATGLPVISASIESVMPFTAVVDIADQAAIWIELIEQNLSTTVMDRRAHRQAVAQENSWETRVSILEQWLAECC